MAVVDTLESESERVEAWRVAQLLSSGISPEAAQTLGKSDADLHRILKALGQGCPEEMLVRIFA